MERDVRYLTVGLVVLALIGTFLAFAAWQAGGFQSVDRDRYTVLVEGGVGGLSKGSRVRYRGVEVGRVLAVRLDPARPDTIRVDIGVAPSTPVTAETEARVKPQGITGLSFIELTTAAPGPPPPRRDDERYPVLAAKPSQLDRVLEDLPQVAEQVTAMAERLERVLSEDNVAHLERTLAGADQLSDRLNRLAERAGDLVGQAEGTLTEVDRTAASARRTLAKGRELMPPVKAMVPEVEATVASMRALSERLDRLTRRNEAHIDRFADQGLDDLRLFLRDGRSTLAEIKALARQLRQDPSQLVYPPKGGGMEIPQ
jgi:phospholipid/cholesterol/gamma-HCH transport system substrate-binding protein